MIFFQLAVLLGCIFIGSRMSGIGLGVMGMIGLLILIFVFGMQPADPPLEVMLIILSVVTAAAALQAAGGMDYLVNLAATILRKNPGQITILGPLVTYLFTLFAGTAHISYSILPIIAEVAAKARVRPERALSMSVTAAHMAITASPVSAATAALLTVLVANGIQLANILLICIPSTLIGVIAGILFVLKRGKELDEDPEFLEKMKDPAFAKSLTDDSQNADFTIKPADLDSLFRKARDGCGVGDFTFHDSRAFALTMLAARVDIKTLARISQHKDINMLMRYFRETPESIAARL